MVAGQILYSELMGCEFSRVLFCEFFESLPLAFSPLSFPVSVVNPLQLVFSQPLALSVSTPSQNDLLYFKDPFILPQLTLQAEPTAQEMSLSNDLPVWEQQWKYCTLCRHLPMSTFVSLQASRI